MVICYDKLKDEVIATKELFSVDQLIEHMKQKGIKFVEMTEQLIALNRLIVRFRILLRICLIYRSSLELIILTTSLHIILLHFYMYMII